MHRLGFLILTSVIIPLQVLAQEPLNNDLQGALKTSSNEPGIMTIIFALLFVICLIYVTGIIYSKLNIIGAQTVKEQLKNADLSKVIVISTTAIGRDKSLHVIEVENKRFLIGASTGSINLLKELEELKKDSKAAPETAITQEEFDIHKKYL